MAFDDWMGRLLSDLSPFLEDSGFAHVRAAAEPDPPGTSTDENVIDFARAAARRQVRHGLPVRMLSPRIVDGDDWSAEPGLWAPLHG